MTTKEILIAARALIADPTHWTTIDYAKIPDGRGRFGFDDGVTCFCGLGAVQHVTNQFETEAVRDRLAATARELFPERIGGLGFATFNDHPDTTHADVLAVFDKAIASC